MANDAIVTTTFPISVLSLLNIPVARDNCNAARHMHSNIMYPTVPLIIVAGISMVLLLVTQSVFTAGRQKAKDFHIYSYINIFHMKSLFRKYKMI